MRRSFLAAALLAIGLVPLTGALIVHATRGSPQNQSLPASTPASLYRGGTPPSGVHAPAFSLRSYRGSIVRMRDLRGKVVLVTFLDTKCKEKCPIIASQIAAALPLLPPPARRQVVALAISVDPRVDSPASVRRFLRRRHSARFRPKVRLPPAGRSARRRATSESPIAPASVSMCAASESNASE